MLEGELESDPTIRKESSDEPDVSWTRRFMFRERSFFRSGVK